MVTARPLIDDVDVLFPLIDELPDVPDENDEPNEIIEFGRRVDLFISGSVPEKEFRNFGATKKEKYYSSYSPIANNNNYPFPIVKT